MKDDVQVAYIPSACITPVLLYPTFVADNPGKFLHHHCAKSSKIVWLGVRKLLQ